ncbi:hypothetical protein [Mangrovibacterium lignilyticum]|uniref:hypothetical protein n=1 Tax=Mangrovibacterium lignilyticum TaxID=2668052 RepID=UPI0013CF7209|nr:hypothetical protein [Mangrovibacterium lignilyticum]
MKQQLITTVILAICMCLATPGFSWTGRNVLEINVISSDSILVEGEPVGLEAIRDLVKTFVANPDNDWCNAEHAIREVDLLGEVCVSKGVVSIQCRRTVDYGFYIAVNDELEKAYREMRNEFALANIGKPYASLPAAYRKAVDQAVPKRISEAEPNYIRRDGQLVRNDSFFW